MRIAFIDTWQNNPITIMAISYVCRKCSKSYDATDSSGNAFCKQCGSFLIRQFTVAPQSNQSQFKPSLYVTSKAVQSRNISIPITLQYTLNSLQQRNSAIKDYVIVPEIENNEIRNYGMQESIIFESSYAQALRLKNELIRKCTGKRIEDVLAGQVVSNEQGECYCVIESHDVPFNRVSSKEAKRLLLSNLKIIYGIGAVREQQLKSQGYQTIEDLKRHLKWRSAAVAFLRLVETKDIVKLQEQLGQALSKSHSLIHYLASFCRDEDFVVVDIETMGMFGRPIILLGIAEVSKDKVVTRQYLVRTVSEEACALSEFISRLKVGSALISYNGYCFDIPFICERLAYYGLNFESALRIPHFDILRFVRYVFRRRFSDCRLHTIESYLGINRGINIPSALVPEFYDFYQQSGNVGPLIPIVEHNKQDLVSLVQIFCSLYQEYD